MNQKKKKLIYRWDFSTNNLVDSIAGVASTATNGASYTSDGAIRISAGDQKIDLGTDLFGVGRTIEIELGNMSRAFSSNVHGRTFMIYDPSRGQEDEGLVYRWQTQCWSFYVDGAWATDSTITDANFFSNCTLKLVSDDEGYISLYRNDILVYKSTRIFNEKRTAITIGGYTDSFYSMDIKSISIYEKG